MKARTITLVIAAAAAIGTSAVSSAQVHMVKAYSLIHGILDQASANVFHDGDGILTNRYGGEYGETYLTWPNASGVGVYSAYAKCASFVTMLLKESYGWQPNAGIGNSPFAEEYFTSIRDSKYGFQRKLDVSQIRTGDILASQYNDGSIDTGHVMLVQSYYSVVTNPWPWAVEKTWYIQVADSTKNPHSNDTRNTYSQLNQGGVGYGVIRLRTEGSNNKIRDWSWDSTKAFYMASARPIVLGRFVGN